MNGQLWSWVLTAIGLAGFFLAGKKVWWCWYVNLANQAVWLVYSLVTHQYGFLVGTAAYAVIFTRNAIAWSKEHRDKKRLAEELKKPIGKVTGVSIGPMGLTADMKIDRDSAGGQIVWEALKKTDREL